MPSSAIHCACCSRSTSGCFAKLKKNTNIVYVLKSPYREDARKQFILSCIYVYVKMRAKSAIEAP